MSLAEQPETVARSLARQARAQLVAALVRLDTALDEGEEEETLVLHLLPAVATMAQGASLQVLAALQAEALALPAREFGQGAG